MRWWPGFVVIVLNLVIAGLVIYWVQRQVIVIVPEGWKPFDLASILLSTAAVVVTGVGIGVAILAFWGWADIRRAAVNQAELAAETKAEEVASDKAESVATKTTLGFLSMHFGSPPSYEGSYDGDEGNGDDGTKTGA